MIARGFKSVIWVGAVGAAAIACYMVSLQVATERADLTRVESQIIAAKRDIRTLQTELGTRGRMSQLESWNAEVLALSAPTASQFLPDQVTLARFDQPEMTLEERSAQVRMASAETAPEAPAVAVPVIRANAPAAAVSPQPMVRQASFTPDLPRAAAVVDGKKPEAKAAPKPKIEQAKADKPAAAKVLASKSEAKLTQAAPAAAKKPDAKTVAKAPVKTATKASAEKPRLAKADEVKGASRKPQGSGGN
ncbi:MAG TPA: hypothetical protein VF680_00510 [Allosphingosinicella sp.]|jgi:hypothetical protein